VTVPFKLEAWSFVQAHAGHARDAGAVNTIDFRNGSTVGYNTDGIGLIRDLEQNREFSIAGKRVLLMGAGGAAQGVLIPLIEHAPALLVVANRTEAKAEHLVRMAFERKGPLCNLEWRSYSHLAKDSFDLVINATSASLAGELPPLPGSIFAPNSLAYDMMYGKDSTPFMKFSQEHGTAHVSDGLGMLVEQAAESFFIWRNVRPQTAPVIAMLKREA
jgi:shikimate dehydrogenase